MTSQERAGEGAAARVSDTPGDRLDRQVHRRRARQRFRAARAARAGGPTRHGRSRPHRLLGQRGAGVPLSSEKAAELAEVVNFPCTFTTNAAATYWQTPKGTTTHWILTADQKIFEYRLDTNPPRAARVQALMNVATYDAAVACWDAKYTYWAMRPFHYDPRFTPIIPVPAHPSYPAAHGCYSGSAAAVLSYLFARDAAFLAAQADEAGMARLWGGIHFTSDIRVGLALGRAVAQRVIERAQDDGSR